MEVKRSELQALFRDLGVATAEGWGVRMLERRVNGRGGILAFREHGYVFRRDRARNLFGAIAAAQSAGDVVTVFDDAPTKPKPPPKPRGRPPGKPRREILPSDFWPDGRPKVTAPSWVRQYYWERNPRKLPKGSVAACVAGELVQSGKTHILATKEYLHQVLCVTFPDREPKKLWGNLKNLVHRRLKYEYGVNVQKKRLVRGGWGYYVPKSCPKRKIEKTQPQVKNGVPDQQG